MGDQDVAQFMIGCSNLRSTKSNLESNSSLSNHLTGNGIDQDESSVLDSYLFSEDHTLEALYDIGTEFIFDEPPEGVIVNNLNHQQHPTESLATPCVRIQDQPYHILDIFPPDAPIYPTNPPEEFLGSGYQDALVTDKDHDIIQPIRETFETTAISDLDLDAPTYTNTNGEQPTVYTVVENCQPLSNSEQQYIYPTTNHHAADISHVSPETPVPEPQISGASEQGDSDDINTLKTKLRYYQKKLALKNYRYRELRDEFKGARRSNKNRLLDELRNCKSLFNPILYELFENSIIGSKSSYGNRWSDQFKTFAANIYIRSRRAHKFIRKTIGLPSEPILKPYIRENGLCRKNIDDDDDNDEDPESEKTVCDVETCEATERETNDHI